MRNFKSLQLNIDKHFEEQKTLTLTQMMEKMKLGQMAILVRAVEQDRYAKVGTVVHYDDETKVLSFIDTGEAVKISKSDNDEHEQWVIVDKVK